MNTPSPLIPQGVAPARGKSSFFIKVLMILTVHVVVIGGMLLQGCKDTKDNSGANNNSTDNSSTAAGSADTTMPAATTPGSVSNAQTAVTTPATGPGQPVGQAPMQPAQPNVMPGGPGPAPVAQQPAVGGPAPQIQPAQTPPTLPTTPEINGGGKEYTIASGDTLGAVAKHNGVSLKALMEANPGVNPKKLKVGQKIQIPAAGASATAAAGATGSGATDVASGDSTTYTVKAGDTLGKIARANHTSYKKIMALNDLKTTNIKIGQKLKLPAKAASSEATTPGTTTTAPAIPVVPTAPAGQPSAPPTVPAPVGTTASNQ